LRFIRLPAANHEKGGQKMLAFILGVFLGTLIGLIVMCFIMGSNPLASSK
jgi:uncharacterized membrane protein YccC